MPGLPVRAAVIWLTLLVAAILNGGFRQSVLIPHFGEGTAHLLSTIVLSTVIVLATWCALPWLRLTTPRAAWLVGVLWLALTIAFEFLAGHFLFRVSWQHLLADYNLARGRTWILVLLATFLSPVVVFHLRPRASS